MRKLDDQTHASLRDMNTALKACAETLATD